MHGLDAFEAKLNTRGEKQQSFSTRNPFPSSGEVPHQFTPPSTQGGSGKGVVIFFFASLIACAIAAVYFYITLASGRTTVSSAKVQITTIQKPRVSSGEVVPVSVRVINSNPAQLKSIQVSLKIRKGETQTAMFSWESDLLAPNGLLEFSDKFQAYGKTGDVYQLVGELTYKLQDSTSVFSKAFTSQVTIGETPVSVRIEGPDKLQAGSSGQYSVLIQNTSSSSTQALKLAVDTSSFLSLTSMIPPYEMKGGLAVSDVPPLTPGQTHIATIQIVPSAKGERGLLRAIIFEGEQQESNTLAEAARDILVAGAGIKLSLVDVSGKSTGTITFGGRQDVFIIIENTSSGTLRNVQAQVEVKGDGFDATIPVGVEGGQYDQTLAHVMFSSDLNPKLVQILPGETRKFRMNIPVLKSGVGVPQVDLLAQVSASTEGSGGSGLVAKAAASYTVNGSVILKTYTSYANAEFQGSGSVPPRFGQETKYTLVAALQAAQTFDKSSLVFTLPPYVSFYQGKIAGGSVVYDAASHKVTVSLPNLDQGASVTASMQVGFTPSQSQVGQSPMLSSGVSLEGIERSTGRRIRQTSQPFDLALPLESYSLNPAVVVQ